MEKQRSKIATSPQLIQVNLRIPHLGGLQVFVPGNLVSLVRSGARHHAGQGGFGALGGLIVEITAGNAFDERFLFLGGRGPVYGDCEVPLVPKKRSVTSHQPLANCVELNVTSTPSG